MKKIHLIAQAKGGVGKSLLMYLMALKYHHNPKCLFVDLDASTHTSKRQLLFVNSDQVDTVSLLDEKGALVRDNLIGYLQVLAETDFEQIYFDMGAPESEQLPALMQFDMPLKDLMEELDFELSFHIVIGGGGAYNASIDYLLKVLDETRSDFKVIVWQSMATFRKFPHLTKELRDNCEKMQLEFRCFGDFEANSFLGAQILTGVREGIGLDDYTIGPRLRLQRELKINFGYE